MDNFWQTVCKLWFMHRQPNPSRGNTHTKWQASSVGESNCQSWACGGWLEKKLEIATIRHMGGRGDDGRRIGSFFHCPQPIDKLCCFPYKALHMRSCSGAISCVALLWRGSWVGAIHDPKVSILKKIFPELFLKKKIHWVNISIGQQECHLSFKNPVSIQNKQIQGTGDSS